MNPLRSLGQLGLGLVVAYTVLVVGMSALERSLVFKPPPISRADLDDAARRNGAKVLTLFSEDGARLYGWHIDRPGPLVLLFTGNGSSVGSYDRRYQAWTEAGFSVLHVNYRGYPGSSGRPHERGLRRDARAAWEYARTLHPPEDIVVYGKSLGGGVAMGLVSALPQHETPRALVLDSTFTRAVDTAAEQYPWLPVGLIMSNRFASIDRAHAVRCPTLVVHSVDDEVIPYAHGERLAAALPRARLLTLSGLGHNDDAVTTPQVQPWLRKLSLDEPL